MHATAPRIFMQRHLGWLLALLLLLPLAQTAATWHLLSHVHPLQAQSRGADTATPSDACALCPTALSVKAGALPILRFAQAHVLPPAAVPMPAPRAPWLAQEQRPYQSRAPPSFRY